MNPKSANQIVVSTYCYTGSCGIQLAVEQENTQNLAQWQVIYHFVSFHRFTQPKKHKISFLRTSSISDHFNPFLDVDSKHPLHNLSFWLAVASEELRLVAKSSWNEMWLEVVYKLGARHLPTPRRRGRVPNFYTTTGHPSRLQDAVELSIYVRRSYGYRALKELFSNWLVPVPGAWVLKGIRCQRIAPDWWLASVLIVRVCESSESDKSHVKNHAEFNQPPLQTWLNMIHQNNFFLNFGFVLYYFNKKFRTSIV